MLTKTTLKHNKVTLKIEPKRFCEVFCLSRRFRYKRQYDPPLFRSLLSPTGIFSLISANHILWNYIPYPILDTIPLPALNITGIHNNCPCFSIITRE